jgi:DNA primase
MEILDQIRQAANIVELASQYTTLKKAGRRHVGLCPFHSEKTPSFTLDDERQLFHCFGCGTGGDVFTLIMEKEGLSFPEAVRYLAEKYNIPLPEKRRLSPQYKKLEDRIHKITEDSLAFFRKNLHKTEEGQKALNYLRKRKISDETIQALKIGYALNSWDALISAFQRKNISAKDLEKAGLAIYNQNKNSYYDRFRGRVIFPIFTESGKVVAFGGRSLFDADPKYLNSPDTPIYTKGKLLYGLNFCKESIRQEQEIILVEGYTDFVALYQAGITNIAAPLGTSLTPDQIYLAKKKGAWNVIVSFDGDTAGNKAAVRAVSLGFENGVQTKVLQLPKEYDPDTFLKKFGTEAYNKLKEKSIPGLKFLIQFQKKGIKSQSPEEKTLVVKNIAVELGKIPDLIVRDDYIKQASEYLEVEEGRLRSIISSKGKESPGKEKIRFLPAEEILLKIIFQDKGITSRIIDFLKDDYFKGLKGEPIFRQIKLAYTKNKKIPDFHEFKQILDSATYCGLCEIQFGENMPHTFQEAKDCIESLRDRSLEMKCIELDAQIKKFQRSGDYDKSNELLSKKFEIKKQLSLSMQQNQ